MARWWCHLLVFLLANGPSRFYTYSIPICSAPTNACTYFQNHLKYLPWKAPRHDFERIITTNNQSTRKALQLTNIYSTTCKPTKSGTDIYLYYVICVNWNLNAKLNFRNLICVTIVKANSHNMVKVYGCGHVIYTIVIYVSCYKHVVLCLIRIVKLSIRECTRFPFLPEASFCLQVLSLPASVSVSVCVSVCVSITCLSAR